MNSPSARSDVDSFTCHGEFPPMILRGTVDQIKKGARVVYNDGRPGHVGVFATVLDVGPQGMTVLFEDRADANYIAFADRGWMDFIELVTD